MTDDSGTGPTLDAMFESLTRMPAPEGHKVEIVEGTVYQTPHRDTHWQVIASVYDQLRTKYPRGRIKSDVRIDFPGHLNGFAADVTLYTQPKDGDYLTETTVAFGTGVDLTGTPLDLATLTTDDFPRG
ncbi:PDDEXK family nuclease [Streptomyces apocyni]|uniref:Uma2 family endonuclease n=1 Tax=Streptomyces apocyni TaxID=2654677 RepID=UPI0012E9F4F6|nr:Uma2 family endonuclease [Streptomyces apocyni]